ncbi:unnamed protein product [Linum tenue]|uniref:N-acetyltransferase domain-containing protein n=2 Tax=Linum TaxID=4005 RepID=A0AAV0HQD9_9ROSI|nr:unnamed protein product [Linum tenue]
MVKPTIRKSVVGTLDLSIRWLLSGEIFPGVYGKAPYFCNIDEGREDKYGYVSNLVVAMFARRQGIATNMMSITIETAKSNGVEVMYVHVDRNKKPALQLYEKMGFEFSLEKIPISSMDPEAAKTARESLELSFQMSNILDTGLDRHTLSVLIALCDLGLNPEALAAVVKELRTEALSSPPPPPASSSSSSS